jgi:hypothetical protein
VHQTYMGQLLKEYLSENKQPGPKAQSDAEDADEKDVPDLLGEDEESDGEEADADEDAAPAAAGPAPTREECISVDMDFAENYEIVHRVEIQSEHWQHQQVTLYIVITHFRSSGIWTSEAHVFVSADRSHDTFFVQRAMAGTDIDCACGVVLSQPWDLRVHSSC